MDILRAQRSSNRHQANILPTQAGGVVALSTSGQTVPDSIERGEETVTAAVGQLTAAAPVLGPRRRAKVVLVFRRSVMAAPVLLRRGKVIRPVIVPELKSCFLLCSSPCFDRMRKYRANVMMHEFQSLYCIN